MLLQSFEVVPGTAPNLVTNVTSPPSTRPITLSAFLFNILTEEIQT
jgi:hypothetical protein